MTRLMAQVCEAYVYLSSVVLCSIASLSSLFYYSYLEKNEEPILEHWEYLLQLSPFYAKLIDLAFN
jgi:hypothetical protein